MGKQLSRHSEIDNFREQAILEKELGIALDPKVDLRPKSVNKAGRDTVNMSKGSSKFEMVVGSGGIKVDGVIVVPADGGADLILNTSTSDFSIRNDRRRHSHGDAVRKSLGEVAAEEEFRAADLEVLNISPNDTFARKSAKSASIGGMAGTTGMTTAERKAIKELDREYAVAELALDVNDGPIRQSVSGVTGFASRSGERVPFRSVNQTTREENGIEKGWNTGKAKDSRASDASTRRGVDAFSRSATERFSDETMTKDSRVLILEPDAYRSKESNRDTSKGGGYNIAGRPASDKSIPNAVESQWTGKDKEPERSITPSMIISTRGVEKPALKDSNIEKEKAKNTETKLKVTFAEDVKANTPREAPRRTSATRKVADSSMKKGNSSIARNSIKTAESARKGTKSSKISRSGDSVLEEPTPPQVAVPGMHDRAPATRVIEGFREDLTSSQMIDLLDAKLQSLEMKR